MSRLGETRRDILIPTTPSLGRLPTPVKGQELFFPEFVL